MSPELPVGETIDGDNLMIGGEGMKGFYDDMLPRFMQKYGKKWGVQVGEVTMPQLQEGYQTMHAIDINDAMRESVMAGQPMFRIASNESESTITPAQRAATQAMLDMLDAAGIKTHFASEAEMNAMAELLRINEMSWSDALSAIAAASHTITDTGTHGQSSNSKDGAKVQQNSDITNALNKLTEALSGENAYTPQEFVGQIALALGVKDASTNKSNYTTITLGDGTTANIRISNHQGNAINFTIKGKGGDVNIGFVIKDSKTAFLPDNNSNYVEFVYYGDKTTEAERQKAIVDGIRHLIETGKFEQIPPADRINTSGAFRAQAMIVFHGSGAEFNRFDSSYMGTGEGRQAFGYGHYLTEIIGIGKTYAHIKDSPIKQSILSRKDFIKQRKKDIRNMEDYDKYAKKIMKNRRANEREYKAAEKVGNESDMRFYQDLINICDSQLKPEYHKALIDSFWDDINKAQSKIDELEKSIEGTHHLYTVEIPDDNGSNYLSYSDKVPQKEVKRVFDALYEKLVADEESGYSDKVTSEELRTELNSLANNEIDGKKLYGTAESYLGTDKAASQFLNSLGYVGIKYQAEFMSGGRPDGALNYVIFNDNDLQIKDHIQFLRTPQGVVYGYAQGGEIYLNRERLNANTPLHEYTHLWDTACKQKNPELWKRGVELMKQLPLWEEVKSDPNYSDLTTDDEIASEVHSRLSGKDGATLLEQLAQEAADMDAMEMTERLGVVGRLKKWLADFWHWTQDTFAPWTKSEAEQVSLDDFVRMPLADLAHGVNPNEKALRFIEALRNHRETTITSEELDSATKVVKDFENPKFDDSRFSIIGERGAANLDRAVEATTRMDNLQVARDMESADKDATAIRLATGWERGADGKWRYEIPDVRYSDKWRDRNTSILYEMSPADRRALQRYQNIGYDMLSPTQRQNYHKLSDKYGYTIEERLTLKDVLVGKNADNLFAAYPELKDVNISFGWFRRGDNIKGSYDSESNAIQLSEGLRFQDRQLNSVLAHEMQHAIQRMEGFAVGGNVASVEAEFNAAKTEWKARAYAHELEETAKELGGEYNQAEVEKALIKEYEDMGMQEYLPDNETRVKGFNYFARGYADRNMDDAIKRFRLETSTRGDFNAYNEYRHLSGEVEARNVQGRMAMDEFQRERTLLRDTEDVAREDQIFLYDNEAVSAETENDSRFSIDGDVEGSVAPEALPQELVGHIAPSENITEFAARLNATMNGYTQERTQQMYDEVEKRMQKGGRWYAKLYKHLYDKYRPLDRLQQILAKQGALLDVQTDAYNDIFRSIGRASTAFEEFYEKQFKPLIHLVRKLEQLDAIKNFDDVRWADGKKMTDHDKLTLYLRAKDMVEAAELGLVERGAEGFADYLSVCAAFAYAKVLCFSSFRSSVQCKNLA